MHSDPRYHLMMEMAGTGRSSTSVGEGARSIKRGTCKAGRCGSPFPLTKEKKQAQIVLVFHSPKSHLLPFYGMCVF